MHISKLVWRVVDLNGKVLVDDLKTKQEAEHWWRINAKEKTVDITLVKKEYYIPGYKTGVIEFKRRDTWDEQ